MELRECKQHSQKYTITMLERKLLCRLLTPRQEDIVVRKALGLQAVSGDHEGIQNHLSLAKDTSTLLNRPPPAAGYPSGKTRNVLYKYQ